MSAATVSAQIFPGARYHRSSYDGYDDDAAVAAYDDIVARSADLGGVYSGEHGTGKRKRKDFLRCHGAEAVEQVRRCKMAVDPDWLLNVGAVFLCKGGPSACSVRCNGLNNDGTGSAATDYVAGPTQEKE